MTTIPADLTGKVDLICYDFDGVMTDNRALVLQDGTEAVFVTRSDGMGVAALRKLGVPQMIVSTEKNPVVGARAEKLKIPVMQDIADKAQALTEYAATHKLDLARVVFIGNDLNDLGVMNIVGYPIAPADAHPTILNLAKYVTAAAGGMGVIREFAETFFPGALNGTQNHL